MRSREFSKALELLRPALEKSPESAELWTMQGAAYSGLKNETQALASFRKALEISPNDLPALEGAAQIEYEADSPAAIPLIQRILRLRPEDETGHGMLAVLEYERGDCRTAVKQFEKAGRLFDAQASALDAYGICLIRVKEFGRAKDIFQRIVALDPGDNRKRLVLASVELMTHQPQDALTILGPLLQSDHPDAAALDLAATAYEAAKQTDRAVATLQRAILTDPANVNYYLDFAHICYDHNAYLLGVNVLNDGISLQPRAAPLFLARGVLYVELAHYDQAEADFERAYWLDPLQSISQAALAVTGVESRHFDTALATVREGLGRNPNDALLLYLQADFLLKQGAAPGSPQFQTAMRAARKAVLLRPTLADARSVLANIYLKAGKYQEAIQESRRALELNPKDQTALYHLIQALEKTGNKREVPELLKRFAQLREQTTRDENERYRYKIVERDSSAQEPPQPQQ